MQGQARSAAQAPAVTARQFWAMLSRLMHMNAMSVGVFLSPYALKTKIVTPKLAETRAFYITCLGMQLVEEWQEVGDVGCILALANDGREALLELYEGKQTEGFSGLSLQFRTANIAVFKASLPAAVECRGPVARPWGSNYLYLADPNGISVIVYDGVH